MNRKTEPVSERDGYTIIEVSHIAQDASVLRTWIEVACPDGARKLCHGVEDAETFIDAMLGHPSKPEN